MKATAVPLRVASESASNVHDSFKVCENRVLVFHRSDSPNRFALWRADNGEQIQRSLRTADKALATERARFQFLEHDLRLKHGLSVKTRFSQFLSQPGCNQEYASGLQQGLNDEVAAVVAQAEALVLQQPTERALDRPAVSA